MLTVKASDPLVSSAKVEVSTSTLSPRPMSLGLQSPPCTPCPILSMILLWASAEVTLSLTATRLVACMRLRHEREDEDDGT